MNEIFGQLGQLFFETVPTVVFVFFLFVLLDRMLFRPVQKVLKQREEATAGAQARARAMMAEAEAKRLDYERGLQAARQDLYRQREGERRAAVEERARALADSRHHAEAMLAEAKAALAQEVAWARTSLDSSCRQLAEFISEKLAGPEARAGGGPEA